MPEEMDEFDTPWRRDLDEIEPALDGVGARHVRRAGRGRERRVARQRHVERDRAVRGAQRRRGRRRALRRAPRAAARPLSRSSPTTTSSCSASAWTSCAPTPTCPRPRSRSVERDPSGCGTPFLVMRRIDGEAPPDIPPYVFGGWVARRDARAAAPAAGRARSSVLARLHEITPDNARPRRSSRSRSTARARSTSSSATSVGTTSGRATACRTR